MASKQRQASQDPSTIGDRSLKGDERRKGRMETLDAPTERHSAHMLHERCNRWMGRSGTFRSAMDWSA